MQIRKRRDNELIKAHTTNHNNILTKFFPRGKKGMGIGQVFTFIIVAVTFALIMIFGYKAIQGFIDNAEQVEFVQFKNGLENSIKRIYTEFGSFRSETFYLPAKYQQICFINLDYGEPDLEQQINDLCKIDVYACSVWKDARDGGGYASVEENVFLKPESIKLKVHNIEVANNAQGPRGFICQRVSKGAFKLHLEGRGDKTRISEGVS